MAKYYDLVGSVYDKNAKVNKYKDEEIIKIPGVTFKSLEDIDKFTAGLTGSLELKNKIDKKYQDKTTFSIRVTKDNENFYYNSIIYNNPNLIQIANSLKSKTSYITGSPRTIKMYFGNNDLFVNAWNDVKSKILNSRTKVEDKEWLYGVFGENSRYTTLINRYINGDVFDNETESLLTDLKNAFREYEIFRKYLTNKDKKKIISNVNVSSSNIPIKTSLGVIEEKLGSDDISYTTLDDEEDVYDPDEYLFLSPFELEQMTGGPGNIFHGQNPKYSTGTGRKH